MKLRSKHGWVAVLAEESNGRKTLYNPDDDPFVVIGQKKKVTTRPHATLLWVTALARIHMEAGRNLTALRPYSCFSLNARARAPLYGPPTADLLDVVGHYELLPPLNPSAVGHWLTHMPPAEQPPGTQPMCELQYRRDPTVLGLRQARPPTPERCAVPPTHRRHPSALAPQATRHDWDKLHSEAGLHWGNAGVERRPDELAYTLGWHRMDERCPPRSCPPLARACSCPTMILAWCVQARGVCGDEAWTVNGHARCCGLVGSAVRATPDANASSQPKVHAAFMQRAASTESPTSADRGREQ